MATAASTKSLSISAKNADFLSKNQKEFNRLTSRIERLRSEILLEEDKYQALIKTATEHLFPAHEQLAKVKMQLAAALDQAALVIKFGKQQLKDIGACIRDLYQEAFVEIMPTDEDKAVYDRWSDTSYDDELEEQEDEQQDFLEQMLKNMFDLDVDLDKVKGNPEEFQRLHEEMQEKIRQGYGNGGSTKKKQKTKAQQKAEEAKEAKIKAAEELKSKSVRSIYISLAKLVHPDTETDDLQRAVKEEEMKKLSAAYERNDLATLLRMEMEWIHKQADHLSDIPDEKLALFVQVLKDQVRELEVEKAQFRYNPRFESVADYGYGQVETGIRKIKADARKYNQDVLEIKREIRYVQAPDAKKNITSLVKEYMQKINFSFGFNFF